MKALLATSLALALASQNKTIYPQRVEPATPTYTVELVEKPEAEYSLSKSWQWKSAQTRLSGFEISASDADRKRWLTLGGYSGQNYDRPQNPTQTDIQTLLERTILAYTLNPTHARPYQCEAELRLGLGLSATIIKKSTKKTIESKIRILDQEQTLKTELELPEISAWTEFLAAATLTIKLGPAEGRYSLRYDFEHPPTHTLSIGARF